MAGINFKSGALWGQKLYATWELGLCVRALLEKRCKVGKFLTRLITMHIFDHLFGASADWLALRSFAVLFAESYKYYSKLGRMGNHEKTAGPDN